MKNQYLINQLVNQLLLINPYKIILFGSYANGIPNENSDIDLLVVTNDEYYPSNFDERMDVYLKVADIIFEYKKLNPIDLLVYTKPMFTKFIENRSIFSTEIELNGKLLYERENS